MIFPNGGESLAGPDVILRWSSSDADGDPINHTVQFSPDNGSTGNGVAVSHTYQDIGPYTAVWLVRDKEGASGDASTSIIVVEESDLGAPTDLLADNSTAYLVPLSWKDNATGEQGFNIIRNGQLIASVGANVEEYTDTVTTFGTPLEYQVEAFDANGTSDLSNVATYSMPAAFTPILSNVAESYFSILLPSIFRPA